jgi:hypothetical protein
VTALSRAAKAVVAFLLPGLGLLLLTVQGGDPVTGRLLLEAGLLSVVTSGAVYAAPNRAPSGDEGSSAVEVAVVVCLVLLILVLAGVL